MSKMAELDAFCDEVGAEVKSEYGLDDGDDLCFNLIESGALRMDRGVTYAAQQVAMALIQQ
jgi:hypothetical protein